MADPYRGLWVTLVDSLTNVTSTFKSDGSMVVAFSATTGTQSSVAASASSVTVLAANTARKGAAVFNDSSFELSLMIATGAASATAFTYRLPAYGYYEIPFGYTGAIAGIWSTASGSARVTEYI